MGMMDEWAWDDSTSFVFCGFGLFERVTSDGALGGVLDGEIDDLCVGQDTKQHIRPYLHLSSPYNDFSRWDTNLQACFCATLSLAWLTGHNG